MRRMNMLAAGAAAAMAMLSAAAADAQTPTDAQRAALRASCSSDFSAHCAGVSPGGMDALVCLEKNEASLSAGCRSAVDAVKGGSARATPSPAAKPPATAKAAQPAASGTTASAGAPAQPAASAARPPMSFREEVRIGARACFGDFSRFCPELPMGHGNMVACLKEHAAQLSPTCREAMDRASAL